MWSKYLSNNIHDDVRRGEEAVMPTLRRNNNVEEYPRDGPQQHQRELPTNGRPTSRHHTLSPAGVKASSELQSVIAAFSQIELFDATHEARSPHVERYQHAMAVAAAARQQLPAAPRRPPVVEWLLTSRTTKPSSGEESDALPDNRDVPRNNVLQASHDTSVAPAPTGAEDDIELAALLQALEASQPAVYPASTARTIPPPHIQPVDVIPDNNEHLWPIVHSANLQQGRPQPTKLAHPAGGGSSGARLTSDSFARLGVVPPRTGSGESLDDVPIAEEANYIHVLDMDAVRRALAQPTANEHQPHRSPSRSWTGGSAVEQALLESSLQHLRSSQHPVATDSRYHHLYDRRVSVPENVPLQPEDVDLLQRGFHDLSKRRSACNAKAAKTRLYDAPTTPRRRAAQ